MRAAQGSPGAGWQWRRALIKIDVDVERRHGGVRLKSGVRSGEFDRFALTPASGLIAARRIFVLVFFSRSPPDCCNSESCG